MLRTQATAVEQPAALLCLQRQGFGQRLGGVPVHLHAQRLHALQQRGQQLAVVELTLMGQVQTLCKAARHGGLERGQFGAMHALRAGQAGHGGAGARQQLAKAHLLLLVLPVPQHQGAVVLKKHGLLQLGNQLLPARHRISPHGHHGRLGNGRFGQWRQHGRGHARGGALGV